jgi:hypothetical protein
MANRIIELSGVKGHTALYPKKQLSSAIFKGSNVNVAAKTDKKVSIRRKVPLFLLVSILL